MGFLDHSTNNIIVDAVLTEKGRKALANGTFNVDKFSLSDDEVDYTIIQKFGRTVGKEKIIKNTPIFEAHTNSDLAQKHRILTVADQTVLFMPTVSVTAGGVAGTDLTFDDAMSSTVGSKTIEVELNIQGVAEPDTAFPADQNFFVYVPKRFLSLPGRTEASSTSSLAMYSVQSSETAGLARVSFEIKPQGLDDTIFNTFGTNSAKNRIDCVVSIVGEGTGIRSTVNVVLNK